MSDATIELVVNGESGAYPDGVTVRALLDSLGLGGRPAAVEVNGSLVPAREHGGATLGAGDRVEVVTLVGGG